MVKTDTRQAGMGMGTTNNTQLATISSATRLAPVATFGSMIWLALTPAVIRLYQLDSAPAATQRLATMYSACQQGLYRLSPRKSMCL